MAARRGDRPLKEGPPKVWTWHEQRAAGVEEHFERVRTCGESWQVVERCESDACRRARAKGETKAGIQNYVVGCCSRFFCTECRGRLAARFRRDFNAARQGVIWQAELAGLTRRFRKGGKFGERFITLTSPHVGTAAERVTWQFDAWPKFLKRWNEWHRKELGAELVKLDRTTETREGQRIRTSLVLPAYAFCQHARFWECTKGDDAEGHTHFHVWAFGPYIDQALLETWWREAWEETSGHKVPEQSDGQARIIVDVRAVRGDHVQAVDENGKRVVDEDGRPVMVRLDRELVKYLTKDWNMPASTMAAVYAALVERRARQASRGFFSTWAVPILRVCATCGVVHERKEEDAPVSYAIAPVEGSMLEYLLRVPERGPPVPAPAFEPVSTFEGMRAELAHEVERASMTARAVTRGLRALAGYTVDGVSSRLVTRSVIQPVSRRESRRLERERRQCALRIESEGYGGTRR